MKVNLSVDPDQITLDDLIFFDEHTSDIAHAKPRDLKALLMRFACAEDGTRLVEEDAAKAVGKLTLSELRQSVKALNDSINKIKEQAIPPENGNASPSP